VRAHAPPGANAQSELLLAWAGLGGNAQIPDPYTQNAAAFEHAWELVDGAAAAIVARLAADADAGVDPGTTDTLPTPAG
jgi:protein-tyrosine phosphatase